MVRSVRSTIYPPFTPPSLTGPCCGRRTARHAARGGSTLGWKPNGAIASPAISSSPNSPQSGRGELKSDLVASSKLPAPTSPPPPVPLRASHPRPNLGLTLSSLVPDTDSRSVGTPPTTPTGVPGSRGRRGYGRVCNEEQARWD